MIGALLAVVIAAAVGWPLLKLYGLSASPAARIGHAFLLGTAVNAAALFLLSAAGIRWSPAALGVAAAVIGSVCFVASRRRAASAEPVLPYSKSPIVTVTSVAMLVLLFGYGLFATAGPLPEFDFLSDWGLKGRVFWEARGIDWEFLETATYRATHADYPILLPLCFDVIALLSNEWNDRWFGILYVAWAAATLVILRDLMAREGASAGYASVSVLALLPLTTSPWIGLAEGPLVAYATTGLLLFRAGINSGDVPTQRVAAILLGIAALVKNEGVSFVAATVMAALVASKETRRAVVRLVPAVAIAATWQIIRAIHQLPTDLATGSVLSRIAAHIADPEPFFRAITQHNAGKPLLWAGIALAAAVVFGRLVAAERFVLLTIFFQCCSYLVAYASTPHDMQWHVRWSWERLVSHVALALTYVLLAGLGELLDARRRETAALM